jgi:hypothetical protein
LAGSSRKASGTSNASATSKCVELEVKRRGHHGHHRGDAKAGTGQVFGQVTGDLDMRRRQADLLGCLAQGGMRGRRVGRLAPPPGKTDLPRMVLEMRSALRQQYGRLAIRWTIGKSTAAGVSSSSPTPSSSTK